MNVSPILFSGLLAASVATSAGCMGLDDDDFASVKLSFTALVAGQPLRMDGTRYGNPGGQGEFEITDFKLYISNIAMRDSRNDDRFVESNSYHLLRFSALDNTYQLTLNDVPAAAYDSIDFSIGVDPQANSRIDHVGDLDPNNQMAWNWNVGYKFLVLEGNLYPDDAQAAVPLVFHVGFSDNYKELSHRVDTGQLDVSTMSEAELAFDIEITEIFKNPWQIDLNELPKIMFDPDDVSMVAQNYIDMIQPRDNGL